jgi:hypothetical protein
MYATAGYSNAAGERWNALPATCTRTLEEVRMPKLIDIMSGSRFGTLTVTGRAGTNRFGYALWRCRCDCGRERVIRGYDLLHARASCKCIQAAKTSVHKTTHGMRKHPLYGLWRNIITRTTNSKCKDWAIYGGRGISAHSAWLSDPLLFFSYVEKTLGPKPSAEYSIDRIDNDRGYVPGNLRWATAKEQRANQRSKSKHEGRAV